MKISIYDICFNSKLQLFPSFTVSMWIMLDQVAVLLLMEVQDSLALFFKAVWDMGAKEQEDENHFCTDLIQMMRWSILRGLFQERHPLQVKSGKPFYLKISIHK